ncbi:DNA-binding SARP family transcriptional activator [Actinoplanes lutulentus]|nr:BTAD domain-containing putative transcriptional regulator [Actinoplanes lutulentus]MBB2940506.1 DNA-binding SARP family transcriptional activator [Actinoplanes lutulentus]
MARALMGVVALVAVPPAVLALFFGSPAELVPSWDAVTTFVVGDRRLRGEADLIVPGVVGLLWLAWSALVLLLLGSLVRVVLGWRVPRWQLPAPLHRMLFGLAGTAVVALAASPQTDVGTPPPSATAPEAQDSGASTLQPGTVTVLVGETRFEYEVKRGDTLSKISRRWLGDADRWPEICRLNRHQHQAGGTRLTDCDLIYPGWNLKLPDDARPPAGLLPPSASPTVPGPPTATPAAPPSRAPATSSPTTRPSQAEETPVSSPTAAMPATPVKSTSAPAPSTHAPNAVPAVTETGTTSPSTDDSGAAATTSEDGVQLSPENWVPWTLAAAISAAVIALWRQRRRRYSGQPDDDPPLDLPVAVTAVRRAVIRNPELLLAAGDDDGIADPPAALPLSLGGVGLLGEGAQAAVRAAVVTALASGDPFRPEARGEVVTDAGTLSALLGLAEGVVGEWTRIHVADSFEDALGRVEALLLQRRRILDEHDVTDLDQLRRIAPDEVALPPVLLVAEAPQAGSRMRTKVALSVGEGLNVSALMIGGWEHGITVDVGIGGQTRIFSGQSTTPMPTRLALLDQAAALQFLTALREAHTGEPPVGVVAPAAVVPLHASRTQVAAEENRSPVPAVVEPGRAQLRVLGQPCIEGIVADGRPLRAKALELAVYLAVHPDGATTREVAEYLYPDARLSQADQRVHTIVSNLRHVLGRTGTVGAKRGHLIKSGGRYQLDPATVDVDVWTLRDLMRDATTAAGERRRELLLAACDLSSAPLALGQHYDWLEPHRETVRRWGTEAHLALADALVTSGEPQSASDLLDKAILLDCYNEALYVEAMRARYSLGDADGIGILLRLLSKALTDLDADPKDTTIALANGLRSRLATR